MNVVLPPGPDVENDILTPGPPNIPPPSKPASRSAYGFPYPLPPPIPPAKRCANSGGSPLPCPPYAICSNIDLNISSGLKC